MLRMRRTLHRVVTRPDRAHQTTLSTRRHTITSAAPHRLTRSTWKMGIKTERKSVWMCSIKLLQRDKFLIIVFTTQINFWTLTFHKVRYWRIWGVARSLIISLLQIYRRVHWWKNCDKSVNIWHSYRRLHSAQCPVFLTHILVALQCFDTVGWGTGRAAPLLIYPASQSSQVLLWKRPEDLA